MKRFLLGLALMFGLMAGAAAASPGCDRYGPPCDLGGSIFSRALRVDALNAANKGVRIEGYCASSCTMLLAVRKACVEPDAALGFHSATWARFGRDSFLNGILLRHYDRYPKLAAWFKEGPMKTRAMSVLPARRLRAMGVPICAPAP